MKPPTTFGGMGADNWSNRGLAQMSPMQTPHDGPGSPESRSQELDISTDSPQQDFGDTINLINDAQYGQKTPEQGDVYELASDEFYGQYGTLGANGLPTGSATSSTTNVSGGLPTGSTSTSGAIPTGNASLGSSAENVSNNNYQFVDNGITYEMTYSVDVYGHVQATANYISGDTPEFEAQYAADVQKWLNTPSPNDPTGLFAGPSKAVVSPGQETLGADGSYVATSTPPPNLGSNQAYYNYSTGQYENAAGTVISGPGDNNIVEKTYLQNESTPFSPQYDPNIPQYLLNDFGVTLPQWQADQKLLSQAEEKAQENGQSLGESGTTYLEPNALDGFGMYVDSNVARTLEAENPDQFQQKTITTGGGAAAEEAQYAAYEATQNVGATPTSEYEYYTDSNGSLQRRTVSQGSGSTYGILPGTQKQATYQEFEDYWSVKSGGGVDAAGTPLTASAQQQANAFAYDTQVRGAGLGGIAGAYQFDQGYNQNTSDYITRIYNSIINEDQGTYVGDIANSGLGKQVLDSKDEWLSTQDPAQLKGDLLKQWWSINTPQLGTIARKEEEQMNAHWQEYISAGDWENLASGGAENPGAGIHFSPDFTVSYTMGADGRPVTNQSVNLNAYAQGPSTLDRVGSGLAGGLTALVAAALSGGLSAGSSAGALTASGLGIGASAGMGGYTGEGPTGQQVATELLIPFLLHGLGAFNSWGKKAAWDSVNNIAKP
jgi:hypothetical protein